MLDKREVFLEAVMLLLKNGCTSEAVDFVRETQHARIVATPATAVVYRRTNAINDQEEDASDNESVADPNKSWGIRRFNPIIDAVLVAYSIYMDYLEWKGFTELGEGLQHRSGDRIFSKFKLCFVGSDYDSNLSMFIECMVQINYVNDDIHLNQLLDCLDKYRKKNPGDLSAHLHHYHLMDRKGHLDLEDLKVKSEGEEPEMDKSNDGTSLSSTKEDCLKRILTLSPGDATVKHVMLTESRHLLTEEVLMKEIEKMMDFLDYKYNHNDTQVWERLFETVETFKQEFGEESFKVCKHLFKNRMNDYWKDVHFRSEQISLPDTDSQVIIRLKNNLLNALGLDIS